MTMHEYRLFPVGPSGYLHLLADSPAQPLLRVPQATATAGAKATTKSVPTPPATMTRKRSWNCDHLDCCSCRLPAASLEAGVVPNSADRTYLSRRKRHVQNVGA